VKTYFTRASKFCEILIAVTCSIVCKIVDFGKNANFCNGVDLFVLRWRTVKTALLLLLLVLSTILTKPVYAQQRTIYLPMVAGSTADINPSGDNSSGGNSSGCSGLNEDEIEMETELLTDSGQQRPVLNCSPTLSAVARARAEDMAARNYFGHINPDGVGPDFLVEQAGYNLPDFYPITTTSNHVESMAAGTSYPTASAAWNALMGSDSHRKHLLATEQFFQEQSEYGVGYAYSDSTRYKNYWVFITAHPIENE